MKKALIAVTSHGEIGSTGKKTGWYLPEVTHIFYPLLEAGFKIDFASPQGGPAPMDQASYNLDDALNRRFVDEGRIDGLRRTLRADEIDAAQYSVIFFAGGHGSMWDFPSASGLQRIASQIYESGGIISAVCHGPAVLLNVKLLNGEYLAHGKEVSAFTNEEERAVGLDKIVPFLLEDELRARGAILLPSEKWQDRVVVSDRLITGQNPQSALSLGRAIARLASRNKFSLES